MIMAPITHPDILRALAAAGHKSTVLITDAHYAAATAVGPNAVTVHLNLTAGRPTIPEVLDAVLAMVVVEHATQIQAAPDALPSDVQNAVADALRPEVAVEYVERQAFYDLARSEDLALAIVTGDISRFGNVLLRLGALLTY
jgi:L-fucose mutarotase